MSSGDLRVEAQSPVEDVKPVEEATDAGKQKRRSYVPAGNMPNFMGVVSELKLRKQRRESQSPESVESGVASPDGTSASTTTAGSPSSETRKRRLSEDRKSMLETEDAGMLRELKEWMEKVMHVSIADPFMEEARKGVVLCRLLQAIDSSITFPNLHTLEDKDVHHLRHDNVAMFLTACKKMGVPSQQLFTSIDLVDNQQKRGLVVCLLAVARKALAQGIEAPPTLARMEALVGKWQEQQHTPRNYSQENLADEAEDKTNNERNKLHGHKRTSSSTTNTSEVVSDDGHDSSEPAAASPFSLTSEPHLEVQQAEERHLKRQQELNQVSDADTEYAKLRGGAAAEEQQQQQQPKEQEKQKDEHEHEREHEPVEDEHVEQEEEDDKAGFHSDDKVAGAMDKQGSKPLSQEDEDEHIPVDMESFSQIQELQVKEQGKANKTKAGKAEAGGQLAVEEEDEAIMAGEPPCWAKLFPCFFPKQGTRIPQSSSQF